MMVYVLFGAAAAAILGVVLEMVTHDKPLRLLQYFTIQSNLIAGFATLWWWWMPSDGAAMFLRSAILWMMVTGIIFHAMISRFYKPTGWKFISNHLTHTVAPLLLFWLYFLLPTKINSPVLWVSYPLIYTLFWLIYGALIDYYPYWFLRPNAVYPDGMGSYKRVFSFIAVMCVSFLGLGYLMSLIVT